MRKPEQIQWDTLSRNTKHLILWQRHEDKYSVDIPDLSFTLPNNRGSGWVELKTTDRWPVREATPVRLHHLRSGQVNFLNSRWECGANCWMLLRVTTTNEWLLISAPTCKKLFNGELTQAGLIRESTQMFNKNQLKDIPNWLAR